MAKLHTFDPRLGADQLDLLHRLILAVHFPVVQHLPGADHGPWVFGFPQAADLAEVDTKKKSYPLVICYIAIENSQ